MFISLRPRSSDPVRMAEVDPALGAVVDRPIPYDTVVIHAPPVHFPPIAAREPGKRIIGLTTWETDVVPDDWRPWLDSVERLIVPCTWNREVFIRAGIEKPIRVVPHVGVADAPASTGSRQPWSPADPFVVTSIGVWTSRKNMKAVVRAYLRAFGPRDHTELVIKTSARDLTRSVLGYYPIPATATVQALRFTTRSRARVRVLTATLAVEAIAALHARSSCYLSMSRGEGFGLGTFDAATRGCPVISPVHGGTREYLGDDYPYAVPWRRVRATPQGFERDIFRDGQCWIEPDADTAARLLRELYERYDEASRFAVAHARSIASRFDWRSATDALLNAIAG